ncbi:DUF5057 domain-containing protein [[Clostridium] fimetarium]|uniref:DUF5057 domain-containing protein n=1 Tax=[Clostridium] fimetarium TaxID=99656 RepID=A0A1I0N187_9FIRM|nr:DUF5057 domain-containing protein [[Clostridium] fimetarium]SEV94507.1 protein of unknown function [[Clostridium] fimetarium]
MIAKMKNDINDRKLFTSIVVFAAIFVIAVVSIIGITVFGGNTLTSPIPTEVVLNGKTYTNANPFVILEIVPQEGLGELGYMVGGNSMPILASDIQKISDGTKKTTVLDAWKDCVGCITGIWDRTKYSDNGLTIEGFADRNLFANSVFGNSNMRDKILVKTVAANAATKEMVDSAEMVYINPGYHSTKFYEAYNLMAQNTSSNNKLSKKYNSVNTDSNKATFSQYNISAEVALEIYIRSEEHGLSVVYDNSQTVWSNTSQSDNYSKLGQLLLSIEPDTFVTEYASQSVSNIYSGTKGSIGVYNSVLQIKRNSANVNWDSYMFVENNTPQYPYFNGGTRNTIYLNDNVLSYSGYNLMDMIFLNGGSKTTDYNGGTYLGTDFDIARSLYGLNANGELSYTSMTRYIIGDFPAEGEFDKINVLEIEPSAAYQYNNYAGAVKIAKYFGYNANIMTEANWTNYVNVKSIASNGFNGMNEDLSEIYDLVIIGSNNPTGYLKTSTIYSKMGELLKIQSNSKYARLSGNDLTAKSVGKLTNYAKTGKPMILSGALYYGDKTIDSSANIYNLSITKLSVQIYNGNSSTKKISTKNIMKEPSGDDSYRYLTKMVKPVITVDSKFKMIYNGDTATATFDTSDLSDFTFSGMIGKTAKDYNLVLYFDKDSNGLFAPESTDDSNEVFLNQTIRTNQDGTFSVNIDLPETLRGYLAWKAVVKDPLTDLSSEDTGGIVIEVNSQDIKTVKLLQICPSNLDALTLNMSDVNGQFQKLFNSVKSVTGINLDVTLMTTRQYENMYKNGNNYTLGDYTKNNFLKNYTMVVVGFADTYGGDDVDNGNGALDNLYDYINKGNSVLFVHDTTTYHAYSDGASTSVFGVNWGYQLTKKFRFLIGMDRYGVSLNNNPTAYNQGNYIQGYTNDFMLRFGKDLNNNDYSMFGGVPSTYNQFITTNKVNRLNQGQITEFPYKTAQDLPIATTHAQYFQLDLEAHANVAEDVVVWYTIGSDNNSNIIYNYTGQDAVNNYYIYSKGNITYSGAGHSKVDGSQELKLFVNTVIRAILSGNSAPEIKVNNAALKSAGMYELFTRDNAKLPIIKFTASDLDLSKNTGKFESGLVYWDTDGNNAYNVGDIVIKTYDSTNPIMNAQENTIDLEDYYNYTYKGVTLRKYYSDNNVKIGFQVTDSANATGNATVSIFYRNLFELN